jgi:GT2 family glycosyltransferase
VNHDTNTAFSTGYAVSRAQSPAGRTDPAARATADGRIAAITGERDKLRRELTEAQAALRVMTDHAEELTARIDGIYRSTLWRLGGPIRRAVRLLRRATRTGTGANSAPVKAAKSANPRTAIDPQHLALPPCSGNPEVTIVIPCYGHVDYTLRCLASIAAHPPRATIEIIVAEDASADPAIVALRRVDKIILRENDGNFGFLRTCNAAAATARGEYLFLLNNDTEVTAGAIDALLALARARPDAGIIGSKLVYPDGRLQEAGGIVWNDFSVWNFGRYEDPARPRYNYVREVDYCSAAAVLIPRAIWTLLGGFDEAFAPAYCEDSDLAFRVRRAGLRVLYQPRSVVVHHERVSHGEDGDTGTRALIARNDAILRERWGETIARDHFARGRHLIRALDRARDRKIVLIIDHYVPEPDRDAGSRTIFSFMQCFQRNGWLVKFWPLDLRSRGIYSETLQEAGIEVIHGPGAPDLRDWLRKNGPDIDAVLISRPNVAEQTLPALLDWVSAPFLYYGHDLHFRRMLIEARTRGDHDLADQGAQMERRERAIWRQVDCVLYPADDEIAVVRELEPDVRARAVLPYCFTEIASRADPVAAPVLMFVAGFAHTPNIDAAFWLLRDLMPLIWAALPKARLVLAGSNPTDEIQALGGDRVEVTGSLSDEELAARYSAARVAVVPLRIGAGVKLKVVEALAAGLPLVTTPIGAQGLPGLADIVPVSGDADEFARAALRLLRDDAAWRAQSAAQAGYAERHFRPDAMDRSLIRAVNEAISAFGTRAAHHPVSLSS